MRYYGFHVYLNDYTQISTLIMFFFNTEWKKLDTQKKWGLVLNLVTTVSTAGAMIFTGILVCQNGKIVEKTLESVELSRNTAYREHRPYISVQNIRMRNPQLPDRFVLEYIIQNSGNTPAYNLHGAAFVKIIKDDRTVPDPNLFELNTEQLYVAPNSGFDAIIEYDGPFDGVAFEEGKKVRQQIFTFDGNILDSQKEGIYFLGKWVYCDNFGIKHETVFCYRYVWIAGGFVPYGKYNDGDKNGDQVEADKICSPATEQGSSQ